jgi:hypothetical protein
VARARRDVMLLALVAVGVMAAYLAIQRGALDSWDGRAMASVGRNLLQHHSLKECCNAFGAYPKDPGPYGKFGIGYSLLLAPLWYLQLHSDSNGAVWLGLANALLLTATTVVIAKTGLVLGWRRSSAVLAALAFALLTMAPLYGAEFFSEPGVTFGSSLLMLGFVVWGQRVAPGALLVGIGTAVAILFRPDSIILLGPIVPLMVLFHSRGHLVATWRSWLPRLALPIGLMLAFTIYYDYLRYAHPFQTGYSGVYDRAGFSTPLVHGVGILLWSPGKSFFVYSPILIAAVPGVIWLARRRSPLAVVIVAMFVLRVVFYARWYTPVGGDSWGPRFLLPLCAVLAIPLGETFEHIHALRDRTRAAAIWVVGGLAAASAVVQLSSVLVSYRDIYPAIGDVGALPYTLGEATLDQRVHRYFWSIGDSHIVWNLRHIGSTRVSLPLHWFERGATAFGLGMLVLAAVMCAGAVGIASLSDRIEQRQDAGHEISPPDGDHFDPPVEPLVHPARAAR